MASYEVHYFEAPARAVLMRMLLDVSGASYKNVFVKREDWPALKPTMAFGVVPKLVVIEADGSRKELFESPAIEEYLAEALGFMPGPGPFERAEALSVVSSLREIEDKIRAPFFLPTVEERKAAYEKLAAETLPPLFKYHERFVRGDFYFGDKPTIADFKLYQLALIFAELYGDINPLKVHASDLKALSRIIDSLAAGKAGDYAKHRHAFGKFKWLPAEWKWGM
ncbi:hypothetical protein EXIGLDRAFT_772579 [Exidia glandulosa HHB12029]|uniref:GST N-terminal domain-containing protein n=1 Tax=Exidia glandulosa HHB12029 TaxID=1314781 RepID=A0A165F917_EXIGL|nr:hypothetical protein EXIGLDRAFT_772579 [Exidia glandulosa HHB12029]